MADDLLQGLVLSNRQVERALRSAAASEPLHMSDKLALEWCAKEPEALAALTTALEVHARPHTAGGHALSDREALFVVLTGALDDRAWAVLELNARDDAPDQNTVSIQLGGISAGFPVPEARRLLDIARPMRLTLEEILERAMADVSLKEER